MAYYESGINFNWENSSRINRRRTQRTCLTKVSNRRLIDFVVDTRLQDPYENLSKRYFRMSQLLSTYSLAVCYRAANVTPKFESLPHGYYPSYSQIRVYVLSLYAQNAYNVYSRLDYSYLIQYTCCTLANLPSRIIRRRTHIVSQRSLRQTHNMHRLWFIVSTVVMILNLCI